MELFHHFPKLHKHSSFRNQFFFNAFVLWYICYTTYKVLCAYMYRSGLLMGMCIMYTPLGTYNDLKNKIKYSLSFRNLYG